MAVNGLTANDNSLWQTTKKILRSQPPVPSLKKTDGTWAISDQEKANLYCQHLSSTFQPHINILCPNQTEKVDHFLSSSLLMTLPPIHIRPSEVEHLIRNSTRRKTPGYDVITAKVAQQFQKITTTLDTHI